MTANQIRHLMSAHEGANLIEAKVCMCRPGAHTMEIPSTRPVRAASLTGVNPLPSDMVDVRTRTIRLDHTLVLDGARARAAYDYQSHTIFCSPIC